MARRDVEECPQAKEREKRKGDTPQQGEALCSMRNVPKSTLEQVVFLLR